MAGRESKPKRRDKRDKLALCCIHLHGDPPTPSGAIVPARPQGLSRELEKQIVDKILGEGYDKRIRPSGAFNNKTGQHGELLAPN